MLGSFFATLGVSIDRTGLLSILPSDNAQYQFLLYPLTHLIPYMKFNFQECAESNLESILIMMSVAHTHSTS